MKIFLFLFLYFGFNFLYSQEKQDSIAPKVVKYSQENINYHHFHSDTFGQLQKELIYWDDADIMLHSYVRSLGQVGKPHEIYENGIAKAFNNDPFTNQNQLYFWDIEKQSLFLNTRTSFIRAKFNQSGNKTQNLGLVLSRNVNPFWNVTIKSQRRTSVGAYLNNVTDHWNLHLTTHFLSRNQRHFWSLSSMLHELKDNLNGGIFQDGTYDYANSFNQNAQPILLSDARWVRKEKSIFAQYSYRLTNDTMGLIWAVQTSIGYQWYKWSMSDESIDSALVSRSIFHNPFGFSTLKGFYHQYEFNKYFGKMALITRNQKFNNQLVFKWLQNYYQGDLSISNQRNLIFSNQSKINILRKISLISFQNLQTSDIFSLSNQHFVLLNFQNEDSLKTWDLGIKLDFQNQNPSLRDRFSTFKYFNRLESLKNYQILQTQLEVGYQKSKISFNANFYGNQIKNAIYFNQQAQIIQNSSMLIIFGTNVLSKYRFKNFYIEGIFHTFLTDKRIIGLSDRMPKTVMGFVMGYRKFHFKNSIELNFEVKNRWISKVQAYLFEHSGFFWYPYIGYEQNAVLIGDFFASAKFNKALIFIRLNNLWENILYPGYYTTYYHPMVNRSLNFGIMWDFND